MKILFTTLLLCTSIYFVASAQNSDPGAVGSQQAQRNIKIKFIIQDSVKVSFNDEFYVIEDSCAQITRYAHLDMNKHLFVGYVKDVSKLKPDVVLTEGKYDAEGNKNGYFVTHYLNGELQAKGNFKNDEFDGHWEIYYDNGKPKVFFEGDPQSKANTRIMDAWDETGKKIVDNGKGTYRAEAAPLYWKGRLLNGLPDGTWHTYGKDDAQNRELTSERYKNGVFQKGEGMAGLEYTDKPRLVLMPLDQLPFIQAESMQISPFLCNAVKPKHLVNAQYANGYGDFSSKIAELVVPYLSRLDLRLMDSEVVLDGEVNKLGEIDKLKVHNTLYEGIGHNLVLKLRDLPLLQPASADGKPVEQKFTITFTFKRGSYSFSYRFLPIDEVTEKE